MTKAWPLINSDMNWLTDRWLTSIAIILMGFGFLGPGLLGFQPPRWFNGDVNSQASSSGPTSIVTATVSSPMSIDHEKKLQNTVKKDDSVSDHSGDHNSDTIDQPKSVNMLRSLKKSSQVTADEKIDVALFLPKSKPSFSPVQKNKVIDSIPLSI